MRDLVVVERADGDWSDMIKNYIKSNANCTTSALREFILGLLCL